MTLQYIILAQKLSCIDIEMTFFYYVCNITAILYDITANKKRTIVTHITLHNQLMLLFLSEKK